MNGFAGRLNVNSVLNVCCYECDGIRYKVEEMHQIQEQYPGEIEDAMLNCRAVAVLDASIRGNKLATYWIIIKSQCSIHEEERLESTWQEDAIMPQGEGINLLDLTYDIVEKTKHVLGGEMIVHNGNK